MYRRRPPPFLLSFLARSGCGFTSSVIFGCVGLTVVILFSCCFLTMVGWRVAEMAPQAWGEAVAFALGIDTAYPILTEEDAADAAAKGLDPEEVALAIEAAEWISATTGVPGDAALYLAQSQLEGLDADFDAATAVQANQNLTGTGQIECIHWLLAHWQKHNVRKLGEREAAHIHEGYTGYTGHESAGELPGGFIPSTFAKICVSALIPSEDPVLATCDPWNDRVRYHATAWWDNQISYDPRDSKETRIESLTGWNTRRWWREKMVAAAEKIVGLGVAYEVRLAAGFGLLGEQDAWLREVLIELLDMAMLLPDEIYLARSAALAGLPSGTAGTGDVTLNLQTEVPVADGESYNVALWAQKNPVIEISPYSETGKDWSFCTQTSQTSWSDYKFAAGFNAGGICANASMLAELIGQTAGLVLVEEHQHEAYAKWPRFTTAVECPGGDLIIRNNSDHTVILEWARNGNELILHVQNPPLAGEIEPTTDSSP